MSSSAAPFGDAGNETLPPPRIPDHDLLRRIGRGAYGEVWLARNVTGALRAVKIVHRSSFDHNRPFEREFEGIRRFEPISRLHESQVDILHVGRGDDYFYYVMELADDQGGPGQIHPENYQPRTLKRDLVFRNRLPFDECLSVAAALSTALEHLHQNGLVHRDVKTSNIIFVNGVAKLADIGLVTGFDSTRSHVGTEGFAAPEGAGTPQADVFSLGKVLYEIATGKDRQHFPELPTDLRGLADRQRWSELNAVIARACRHDPSDRYRSAAEMRADLELIQSGRSLIRARRRKARMAMILWTGAVLLLTAPLFAVRRHLRWAAWTGSQTNVVNATGRDLTSTNGAAVRRNAVQWPVAHGGNGHWYEPVPWSEGSSWENADAAARAKGGHLVDIRSAEENAFVFSLIDAPEYWTTSRSEEAMWSDGPWIGAIQRDLSNEPDGNFVWSHGDTPLSFANWHGGLPDNRFKDENYVKFFTLGSHERSPFWNDAPGWTRSGYVIEYEFDPAGVSSKKD